MNTKSNRLDMDCVSSFLFSASMAWGDEPQPLRDAVECTPRQGFPNWFAKVESGEEVRVGYLGGSIRPKRVGM